MANIEMNTTGLRCPEPVLKLAAKIPEFSPGDTIEIVGDCPTFEKDIRTWCERLKKNVLWARNEGGSKVRIQIKF